MYTIEQTILNGPYISFSKLVAFLFSRNKYLLDTEADLIISSYCTYGELTSIGNILPFAQACYETEYFTSKRWILYHDPVELGVTMEFSIPQGILAQYAHLISYAKSPEEMTDLEMSLINVDPRVDKKLFGSAKVWKDINNRCASQEIISIANQIKKGVY